MWLPITLSECTRGVSRCTTEVLMAAVTEGVTPQVARTAAVHQRMAVMGAVVHYVQVKYNQTRQPLDRRYASVSLKYVLPWGPSKGREGQRCSCSQHIQVQ